MAMHFDKELINPNISRTVRFTPVLYDWLMQVKERENLSFNQVVLQCCKNCMEEDAETTEDTDTVDKQEQIRMEKRQCMVGICDDRAEDIVLIEDALHKALIRTGQPVDLTCRRFTDGEKLYAATLENTFHLSRFCVCP